METFCSYVLLSKKSKHPLNTTRANDAVIPGKDQGPYPNDGTMPATNQDTSNRPLSSDSWSKPGMTT